MRHPDRPGPPGRGPRRAGPRGPDLPDEALRPIVPAARWLLGVEGFGRDERAWKELLAERYARRLAAGEVRDPRAER